MPENIPDQPAAQVHASLQHSMAVMDDAAELMLEPLAALLETREMDVADEAAADGFDGDMAGCMGGGPPFPGQDFTAFHCGPVLDLDSGDFVAVISIEPVPDNGPGPFQFKPLAGMIPTDALMVGGVLNNQVADTFPTGTATITGTVPVTQNTWGMLKASYR